MLKLRILSTRTEGENYCFNCEGNLEDYINSLPEQYKEYDIQRGIVANAYLDNLANTVLSDSFIPPIVLIADNSSKEGAFPEENIIINEYKILDGLQRTVRLQSIYQAFQIYTSILEKMSVDEIETYNKFKLKKIIKEDFDQYNIDASYLLSVIQYYKNSKSEVKSSLFKDYKQWFIVWDKLDKTEQINKMLVLNAGHKSMDLKHQLELLFLNILPLGYLDKTYKIKNDKISDFVEGTDDAKDKINRFVRAKDINSAYFYKKKKVGQIHLSHLISALIAFERTIPFTLKQGDLQNIQNPDDNEFENLKIFFDNGSIDKIIQFIEKIDFLFQKEYSNEDEGLEWLGRESIQIGLFSAFGKYYEKQLSERPDLLFSDCLDEIYALLHDNIEKYKISEFNKAKTNIDITKLNIGNVFKFTTYYATCKILFQQISDIDWILFFKDYSKKVNDECN